MEKQSTIHGFFENHARQTPNHIATIFEEKTLTYQQLNERANQLAHYLLKQGIQPDHPIAICMDRSIDLLIVILGILKAGGAYVPLDPLHPEARLLFKLKDNLNPIVILKSESREKFINYLGPLVILDIDLAKMNEQPTHNPNIPITEKHLSYIIYTSGSTGNPKGVLVEHGSVINHCRWFNSYSNCQSNQRIDFSSNYIFDMAITSTVVSLMLGLTVVICDDEVKKVVRHYLNYLHTNKVNIIKMTPSYFKVLLHEVKNNPIALPHLCTIILGGENLSTADCASWLSIYPSHTLYNEYGPTEATVAVSHFKVSVTNLPSLGTSVPIGHPGPNMACYILKPDHTPVNSNEGEIGELAISGLCLARGYLNQPLLTQQQFIMLTLGLETTRVYKTGDLCRYLKDGSIEYLGRADHQVKIRGFRVELSEIEQCMMAHPTIKDVVVLAQKEELHEKLIAYYVLKETATPPSTHEIRRYLEEYLPDYMIPTAFVRVDAFPLNANGKLDRQALPIPRFTTNQHYLAPTTTLEKTLAEIWSEELDLKLIGIEDNFFELGGHSLSAARIISKINSTLRKDISLREFYEASTIKKLIPIVYRAKNIDEESFEALAHKHQKQSILPLSDFQLILWLSNLFEPKAKKINITARRRLQGRLDPAALSFAFNAVFKKHEILSCQILNLRPAMKGQTDLPFNIIESNLTDLSQKDSELVIEASLSELIYHYPWHKNKPKIIVKLFQLKNNITELQICMPHIISDDVSPDILFTDLSTFYLLYHHQSTIETIKTNRRYREYQFNEQHYSQERITKDIVFWESYFSDTSLFSFPNHVVVPDMASKGLAYSTYTEIPEHALSQLLQFCAENCVSFSDGLCAVLTMTLINSTPNLDESNKNIFVNIVKSTRDHQKYDDTIGCFLRLEPIKISLNKQSNFVHLSKQIHQATIDTAPYQRCSGLVKFACINSLRKKKNIVKQSIIGSLIYLYTKIFPKLNLDRRTFTQCERLITAKKPNEFIINVNVHKSFISGVKGLNKIDLFGLKQQKTKNPQYDLLNIDQFFDVCLLRDDNENTPYIVISANLKHPFREWIAMEMVRMMSSLETKMCLTEGPSRIEAE